MTMEPKETDEITAASMARGGGVFAEGPELLERMRRLDQRDEERIFWERWERGDRLFRAAEDARRRLRDDMPDNPAGYGWKAYSQFDEDGVVAHCLARIESRTALSRTFLEIGCGDGLENNTHLLALDGFRGCWFDGSADHIAAIGQALGGLDFPALRIRPAFFTRENAAALAMEAVEFLGTRDIDVLSLDIDGNDAAVAVGVLSATRPKLLVVEYNAKFPPPRRMTMPYDASHTWGNNDYYGVSLQAWVDLLAEYRLVACTAAGINAFFVRDGLADAFTPYPPERLFQPARIGLLGASRGHPGGFRWLANRLRMDLCV